MNLFIVILSIAFLQVWGAANPLHKDKWFAVWADWCEALVKGHSAFAFIFAVLLPFFAIVAVQGFLLWFSPWLLLPLGMLVLLYSFGRGEFADIVSEYTKACYIEDWPSALERARRLGVDVENLADNDWPTLHKHVLDEAGYRGFERMFAILFWCFSFGPAVAFLYRLNFLYSHNLRPDNPQAQKLLWVLEWPAVRLLGLSFALTGNFVGCFQRWKECFFCARRSTVAVLSPLILGALLVDDSMTQTDEVTRKELNLLTSLYTRTLWLWLAAAAVLIIVV
ncbi:histidine kinase [Teredinibacter turnerae]|uniref:histidine kinase n=1 Tax=Teredinibacter turnerae TaxID=2426 RepID=UPI00035E2010|nr:histidine kinase [Teredinibacter turnerae]